MSCWLPQVCGCAVHKLQNVTLCLLTLTSVKSVASSGLKSSDVSERGLDVSETGLDVSETGLEVLERRLDVSETGLEVSKTGLDVSETVVLLQHQDLYMTRITG